jgi:hypothetical protein
MTDLDAPDPAESSADPPGDADRDRILRLVMARCPE